MLFPYGDDQVHGGHKAVLSYLLIALNVLIFFWQLGDPDGMGYAHRYAFVPSRLFYPDQWYTLFSSLFLHAGLSHLIGNMVFLWIFADNIESTIGSWRFLLFYLAGGIVATLAHVFTDPLSSIPLIGASGAISAVLGAYLVLYPRSRIKVFFIIFPFRVPAILFLVVWFYMQMSNGVGSLNGAESGVAWWAHIGGFVFGVLSGFWMRTEFTVRRLRVR